MAVTAAETGHLVLGTLHTRDAASTLNRLVGAFPPKQQPQIRAMTAESLRGVLCQQLLPRVGGGQVLAYELMVANGAVRSLVREGKPHLLPGVMQTGTAEGMCTMDRCLVGLVRQGAIARETAAAVLRSNQAAEELAKLPEPQTTEAPVLDTNEFEAARREVAPTHAAEPTPGYQPGAGQKRRYLGN